MNKIYLFLLKAISRLPLGILYVMSDFIYLLIFYVVRYRRKLVNSNLSTAFPEKSAVEIKKIERQFYRYLSDQMVETIKLFHISDEELSRRVKIFNADYINDTNHEGKNAVVLMGHYCNWEWVQEIVRDFIPDSFKASIYNPPRDNFWDDAFLKLRGRWEAHIVPMATAPRVLLNKNNFPWVCGFIADQRPGQRSPENCMKFLHHTTYFIYGPEVIGKKVDADFFYLEMQREKRGHYTITFHKLIPDNMDIPYPYTRTFWKEFEKTIRRCPPYWLWSHNRWKHNEGDIPVEELE